MIEYDLTLSDLIHFVIGYLLVGVVMSVFAFVVAIYQDKKHKPFAGPIIWTMKKRAFWVDAFKQVAHNAVMWPFMFAWNLGVWIAFRDK
jgi:hypothetical protein